MNILIDARPIIDSARGGIGRVTLALVSAYAETFPNDTLTCVTTGSSRHFLPPELSRRANVHHKHIRIPNKLWSSLSCLFGASLIRWSQSRANPIDAAFFPNIGFIGAIPRGVSTTLLLHDLSFLIEPRWFSWKQRFWHRAVGAKRLIRSASHLLAVSQTTKDDAVHLLSIPENNITIIPIGGTMQATATRERHSFVLALGAGDLRKNITTAIEAVRVLRKEEAYRNLELVFIGGRYSVPEPDRAWIRFVARPSDTELASLYAHADALLYPSWYEGYGLPLHEAHSFGVPCIASTSGALPETAPPGTIFAHPAKPHHWAAALRDVLQNTSLRVTSLYPSQKTNWKTAATILRETLIK